MAVSLKKGKHIVGYDPIEAKQQISAMKAGDEKRSLTADEITRFCAISDFLGASSKGAVLAIQTLESNIEKRLGDELDKAVEYCQRQPERAKQKLAGTHVPSDKDAAFKGILSGILKKEEERVGFSPSKVPTYLGRLTDKAFYAQEQHFKDFVVRDHGEFTHRIQWYLLTVSKIIPDERANYLMKEIFNIRYVPPRFQESYGMWDVLFDRLRALGPLAAKDAEDFRCPDYVTHHLVSGKYKFLSAFIGKREEKRNEMKKSGTWIADYVDRKMKWNPKSLTESEQKMRAAILTSNILNAPG